ncbi:murein biosynthesis integral membrane protein MurJ [Spelaeicoccus albus]|uniref:Putative peptidoglycan lipid II flippase n=1 Tax=Spelaeicoccus albus TaxID=1280376 RepID=A0A7Z0A8Y5_9MICO|nr:murein biosynthesis integral membrane protein MurJ [Spelaeicoccus albus]NYI66577.1 putative peptidoglycan lipid II flippase [Spelaeicoccus albus]
MTAPATARFGRASAIMGAGSLVSRVLGLVKIMVLATAIGVTFGPANAFDVANKIPNTLYMLIGGGVMNAVLVPQVVRASKRPDGGRDYTDRLLTLAIGALLIITLVLTACSAAMVWVYTSVGSGSWTPDQTALATAFAYWCLPQVFFYGLYTLLGQVLNARGSFGPYMWAPVVNNVVAIAGLVTFIILFGPGSHGQHGIHDWDSAKIAVLAGTATLGVVAQALILIWPLRRDGFGFTPRFGWRGVGLGTASRVASWSMARLIVAQVGFAVISNVAAGVGQSDASNSAYSYGYLVFMLPHGLATVSISTALFTAMSAHAADGDTASVRANLSVGLRTVGVMTIFATAAIVVIGGQIGFTLTGGAASQGAAVGKVIVAMIVGIVPFSASYLLSRVFYAYEDARTPFFVQIWTILVTTAGVLASSMLPDQWVVVGIGVSMSVGNLVGAVIAAAKARSLLGGIDGERTLRTHVRLAAAAIVSAVVGAAILYLVHGFAWSGRLEAFTAAIIVGIPMTAVYFFMCLVFNVREIRDLIGLVLGRFRRSVR